ncbi:MAG: HAMP domain-containing histidine kinase [Campylobacterales bacterium]|nr:HAMP domain-containing histidine kinase [Campylobacterales bacterium]
MLRHERRTFLQFFAIYFGSVALLILASGFMYYEKQKKSYMVEEHFSMIEYMRQLKMHMNPQSEHITHKVVEINIPDFNIDNFTVTEEAFYKYVPQTWEGGFILVRKDKQYYKERLHELKTEIILIQVSLLAFFAFISFFLAKKALRPMQNAIEKLDTFSKDLIHDLNTPITSILLNIKILEANTSSESLKALGRIKQSADNISELHKNLSYLLHDEGIALVKEQVFEIVEEAVAPYKKIYPELHFYIEYAHFEVKVNKEALRQVLSNLISNACKYNTSGGFVKIYKDKNRLCIEDSGVGIKDTNLVFQRSYKEQNMGSGIGLDIVKRLCNAMYIEVFVSSKEMQGSCFSLEFNA